MDIKIYFLLYLLLALIFYFLLTNTNEYYYKLQDEFLDSTDYGTIRFLFFELDNYDSTKVIEVAHKYNDSIYNMDSSKFNIVISHFYKLSDSITPTKKDLAIIKKKYPMNLSLPSKLLFIPNAFTYTGFSRRVENSKIPQDTLIQTPVFIPRKGYKAADIMKQ